MEPNYTPDTLSPVEIDHIAADHLQTISKWARIVAIIAIINIGITILATVLSPQMPGVGLAFVLPIMLLYGAVIVVLNIFLLRFANRTAASLNMQNQDEFNAGIGALRTYFMIIGVLVILGLAVVVIAMFGGLLGALVSMR